MHLEVINEVRDVKMCVFLRVCERGDRTRERERETSWLYLYMYKIFSISVNLQRVENTECVFSIRRRCFVLCLVANVA